MKELGSAQLIVYYSEISEPNSIVTKKFPSFNVKSINSFRQEFEPFYKVISKLKFEE